MPAKLERLGWEEIGRSGLFRLLIEPSRIGAPPYLPGRGINEADIP
jgi:hypothetical protein